MSTDVCQISEITPCLEPVAVRLILVDASGDTISVVMDLGEAIGVVLKLVDAIARLRGEAFDA
jgi:hypothetical protein